MEIDDKGGEIVQRYKQYGGEIVERLYKHKKDMKILRLYKRKRQDMDMNKEEATLEKRKGSNSWTREAHKQGEQAHEL